MAGLFGTQRWRAMRTDWRTYGWKGMFRRKGWRFVLLVIAAYLIRDLFLYVLLPLLVYFGFLKG